MNCAPLGLTSVTSSWKPSCFRNNGRTSLSKTLFNSVSLPLLTWNWTLRAYLMILLLEPLNRWSSSESPKRRAGLDKVPKPAWTFEGVLGYHTSRAIVAYATNSFQIVSSKDYERQAPPRIRRRM